MRYFMLILLGLLSLSAYAANDRVLVILGKQFNREEFWIPYYALQAAGYRVDIAGIEKGPVALSDKGTTATDPVANLTLAEVKPEDYAGLLIPGGYSPGNLEKYPRSLEICTAFMKADKPVAAICHGPRLLMRAGLMKDRIGTCLNVVADELCDDWVAGAYGKYLDQPVVVDRNLVTSRYPNDPIPLMSGWLPVLAKNDGLPFTPKPAHILIISTTMTRNDKQYLRGVPTLWGITVDWVSNADDAKARTAAFDPTGYDIVVLPDVEGTDKLLAIPEIAELVKKVQDAGKTALLPAADKALLTGKVETCDGNLGSMLKSLVAIAQRDAAAGTATPGTEPEVVITLTPGFDQLFFTAVCTYANSRGQTPVIAGTGEWVLSNDGLPVQLTMPSAYDEEATKGLNVRIGSEALEVAGDAPDTLNAIVQANHLPPAKVNATAAIALREGFDDYVFLATYTWLSWKGYRVAIIGPKVGELRGLNGVKAAVGFSYADAIDLPKTAIIIAPGGVWPTKTEVRQATQPKWIDEQEQHDTARLKWLNQRYQDGAKLVTFGFDSLAIGKGAAFKDKLFASSDQAMWSFGKEGGKYSSAPAVLSTDHLISTKGASTVADALKLLEGLAN